MIDMVTIYHQEVLMNRIWTEAEVRNNLLTNDKWVIRGAIALFNKQTESEKAAETTNEKNHVGLSAADAHYVCWVVKNLFSQDKFPAKSISKVRAKIIKYSGQLARIANGQI